MAEIIRFDAGAKEKYKALKAEINEIFKELHVRENDKGETFAERVKGEEFAHLVFGGMDAEKLILLWRLMPMLQDAKELEEEMGICR